MCDREHTPAQSTDGFADLALGERVLSVVGAMSFDQPTEVQQALIPVILSGDDAVVRARSGEGKTNAYILPMAERVKPGAGLQMIVLLPTGGIAARMQRNFQPYAEARTFHTSIDAGARRDEPHDQGIPDILLATPRRAAQHLASESDEYRAAVSLIVVDEYDAMLDMGEGDSIESVLNAVGENTQIIVISGELDDDVDQIAQRHLRSPQRICPPPGRAIAERTAHVCYHVTEQDPFDALVSFCKQIKPRLGLIYAENEDAEYELLDRLRRVRVECRGLNERGRPGGRRERGRGASAVIVISGAPPRQLSTMPFSHVLHYALPDDIDAYVGRLAQCDRLNRRGASVLFVPDPDHSLIQRIESLTGSDVTRMQPLAKPERTLERRDRGDSRYDNRRQEQRPPAQRTPPAIDDDARGNVAPKADTQSAGRKTLGGKHVPRGRRRRMW
jgi:superfamily II DNA/RNA helicase